jgi:hypothetical protein
MRSVIAIAVFVLGTASAALAALEPLDVPTAESASFESELAALVPALKEQQQTVESLSVPLSQDEYVYLVSIKAVAGAAGVMNVLDLQAAEVGCLAERKVVEMNLFWIREGKEVPAGLSGHSACAQYRTLLADSGDPKAEHIAERNRNQSEDLCEAALQAERNVFVFCRARLKLGDFISRPGLLNDINAASATIDPAWPDTMERDRYAIADFLFSGGIGLVDDATRLAAYRLAVMVYNSMATDEVCRLEYCRSKKKLYQGWIEPYLEGQYANDSSETGKLLHAMAEARMIDDPDAPPSVSVVTYPPPQVPGWSAADEEQAPVITTAPSTSATRSSLEQTQLSEAPPPAEPTDKAPTESAEGATTFRQWWIAGVVVLSVLAAAWLLRRRSDRRVPQ